MPELLNHRHCRNCDRAVPYSDEVCSKECREVYAALQKKRSRTVLVFYVGSAVLVIVLGLRLLRVY